MNGPDRIKIFISYNHLDSKWVKELREELEPEFEIFTYEENIQPGELWLKELEEVLKNCHAGITVWSRKSIKNISGYIFTELSILIDNHVKKGQPLIPVIYGRCQKRKIPKTLQAFQYLSFGERSPGANKDAMNSLRKALHGHSPGSPTITTRPISLRTVFILLMIFIGMLTGAKALYTHIHHRNTYLYLRSVQQKVHNLESQINSSQDYLTWAKFEGEKKYSDPVTKKHLLTDVWIDGKLTWRNFYQDNRLIARDVFRYANEVVIEKIRYYMDTDQRIFLIDHFTQDGLLTKKRHCRQGPELPCDVHLDDMRSPLPPPQIMFYR